MRTLPAGADDIQSDIGRAIDMPGQKPTTAGPRKGIHAACRVECVGGCR